MNTRSLALLAAVVALLAPLSASAGALGEAQNAGRNPASYDGARAQPEGDAVLASSSGARRASAPSAVKPPKSQPSVVAAPVPGDDAEIKVPKKDPWISWPLAIRAGIGALVGLLIGSLFGPVGLVAGPLIGAGLFYGVTKYMSWKASKEADAS